MSEYKFSFCYYQLGLNFGLFHGIVFNVGLLLFLLGLEATDPGKKC